MGQIDNWIDLAIKSLQLSVERLNESRAEEVRSALKGRFVEGNPRTWWWDSLIPPFDTFDSTRVSLLEILPDNAGQGYLIAETEDYQQPVYRLDLLNVEQLLSECPFFEYYVANATLKWLVIESHHNQFYVSRS